MEGSEQGIGRHCTHHFPTRHLPRGPRQPPVEGSSMQLANKGSFGFLWALSAGWHTHFFL